MSQWLRLAFTMGSIIAIALAAVIYVKAAKPLIKMANNDLSGPFTSIANDIEAVVPVVLGLLLLGVVVYLLIGPVQRERNVRRVRRRP